jgi:hypothetical protein
MIWFRPKRFLHYFAAYYPVTWQGWLIFLGSIAALTKIFIELNFAAHTLGDTLLNFSLPAIATFALFDICTLHFGEYPNWWKKKRGE